MSSIGWQLDTLIAQIMCLAIGPRRIAELFLKLSREVAVVVEADLLRDVADGVVGLNQHLAGAGEAVADQETGG